MTLGKELKAASDQQEKVRYHQEAALYWSQVGVRARALYEQAEKACRKALAENKRCVGFGEESDQNVMKELVYLLEKQELKVVLHYHEGTPSAYLHDDRASYYWVEISW